MGNRRAAEARIFAGAGARREAGGVLSFRAEVGSMRQTCKRRAAQPRRKTLDHHGEKKVRHHAATGRLYDGDGANARHGQWPKRKKKVTGLSSSRPIFPLRNRQPQSQQVRHPRFVAGDAEIPPTCASADRVPDSWQGPESRAERLDFGRCTLSAGCVGGAKKALAMAVESGTHAPSSSGRPSQSFHLVKQKLARMAETVFANGGDDLICVPA